MSNKTDELFKGKSREEIIAGLKAMESLGQTLIKTSRKMLGNFEPSEDPEIRIIEAASLPAAYYMRDSVMEAIKTEILKDHKAGQPIPPGAELINQEDPNGQTEKISDLENDNDERGDTSESNSDSENDGDRSGSSSEDHPGESAQESSDSTASQKAPGEK